MGTDASTKVLTATKPGHEGTYRAEGPAQKRTILTEVTYNGSRRAGCSNWEVREIPTGQVVLESPTLVQELKAGVVYEDGAIRVSV